LTTNSLANLSAIRQAAQEAIAQAGSLDALRQVDIEHFGKKAPLTQLNQTLGAMSVDERKTAGAQINEVRALLASALQSRKSVLADTARRAQLEAERLDLTEVVASGVSGRVHLITQTIHDLEDIFVGMGFSVFNGPEVETDDYNFEKLNFPPAHPARTMHDTFHLELGEKEQVLLRTHTSPMQIRVMESMKPPIYAVMPGRCYRRDTADARHLPVFHQIEALVIDRGITMGHLAGTIETFSRAYFGKELKARLRPGFFPFTEPSAEYEITCPFCDAAGCKTCSQTGWIELGGCGMVHPNVLRNGGIDPEEFTGFAWGFGIDRLAMNRHDIEDLRVFLDNDVRLLRQF
jgi:phenylalanyl-tRNA synthetase alpha chain